MSAPQNLTATATDTSIDLSWDPPSSSLQVVEYNIYRATSSGSSKSDYTQIATVDEETTTYTDSGLTEGQTYHYRVTSDESTVVDSFEDGDISEYSGATGDYSVKSGGVKGNNYLDSTLTNGTIDSPSGFTTSSGSKYEAYVKHDPSYQSITTVRFGVQSSGETYGVRLNEFVNEFKVVYLDGSGNLTNIAITDFTVSRGEWYRFVYEWGSSGGHTVTLYDSNESQVAQISGTDSKISSGGLGFEIYDGAASFDHVADITSPTESGLSNEATATTALPAPSSLSVDSVSGSDISLSWTDNATDEDGYRIYRSLDGGASWTQSGGDLAKNSTSYTLSSLLYGREYHLSVEAFTQDASSYDGRNPADVSAVTEVASINNHSLTYDSGTFTSDWSSNQNTGNFYIELVRVKDGTVVATDTVSYSTQSVNLSYSATDGTDFESNVRVETVDVTGQFNVAVTVTPLPSVRVEEVKYSRGGYVTIRIKKRDDNSTGRYELYRSESAGKLGGLVREIENLSTTKIVDDSVEPGQTYHYTVRRVT